MKPSAPMMLAVGLLTAPQGFAQEPARLEPVVVTGTRTEKPLSESTVRTALVRRAELEGASAQTLSTAVGFTPGIRVENNCQNCGFSQIRMLGLDGAYTQILTDGQPLMSAVGAVYGIDQIPTRAVERIEVIKGGGSALYGPGAVGGVINLISRDPRESGGEVMVFVEDRDGSPAKGLSVFSAAVSADGRSRMTLFGHAEERDAYDRTGDGFSDLPERTLQSFGLRYRQQVGEDSDLVLHYGRTAEDRRGGDQLDQPEFRAEIAESLQTVMQTGGVVWSQALSERLDYRLAASLSHTERDSYYGAGQDPDAYGFSKSPVWVLDAQVNHPRASRTFTWGVQHLREELEDRQPAHDRFLEETYTNTGLYAQDDWRITEDVNLILGARLDRHSEISGAILSPRVAVSWAPAVSLTFRAAYAEGFRAPQTFDEDLHVDLVGGEGVTVRNDPGLKEERSQSVSLGGEWTPVVGPGFALLETNLFHTRLRDAFFLDPQLEEGLGEEGFVRVNRGGARVQGVEWNVGYQIPEVFELVVGWVAQTARFDEAEEDFGSRDFFRTPDHHGVLRFTARHPWADLFVGARYTGSMRVPHFEGYIDEDRLEKTRSFLTWDVSLSREIAGVHWTVGVRNLTDAYQSDLDRGPDRDADYVYGPNEPRTAFVSAALQF